MANGVRTSFRCIGVQRHRFAISEEDLQAADTSITGKPCTVPPEFAAVAEHICREESRSQPSTAVEAKDLYLRLVQELVVWQYM